jgi:hypothetical protein
MLVCSVVLRPQRHTVAADVVEVAEALDNPGLGTIFVTLSDAPGNARDLLDAFLGQRMVEAANATAVVDALSAHPALLLEEISAAVAAQDASRTAATTWATFEPAMSSNVTLSGGNLIATNTGKSPTNQGASVGAANSKTVGKYYFETTFITYTGGDNVGAGVGTTSSTYSGLGGSATTGDTGLHSGAIWASGANTGITVGLYGDGQVAAVAVNLDTRRIWFKRLPSGNWNNSGTANPATNTGGITIPAGAMVPFATFGGGGGAANNVVAANFGGSVFSGAVPSSFIAGWPIGGGVAPLVERERMVATVMVNSDGTARQANADGVMVNL